MLHQKEVFMLRFLHVRRNAVPSNLKVYIFQHRNGRVLNMLTVKFVGTASFCDFMKK